MKGWWGVRGVWGAVWVCGDVGVGCGGGGRGVGGMGW